MKGYKYICQRWWRYRFSSFHNTTEVIHLLVYLYITRIEHFLTGIASNSTKGSNNRKGRYHSAIFNITVIAYFTTFILPVTIFTKTTLLGYNSFQSIHWYQFSMHATLYFHLSQLRFLFAHTESYVYIIFNTFKNTVGALRKWKLPSLMGIALPFP